MIWFPTLVGTSVFTIIGLLLVMAIARATASATEPPSKLAAGSYALMLSWCLLLGGAGHGAGILPLPAALTCILGAISMPNSDGFQLILMSLAQMTLIAYVFFLTYKRRALKLQANVTRLLS